MTSAPQADFAEFAAVKFQGYLMVETAGLFWIGAELAILFAMLEGLRHIRQVGAGQFNLYAATMSRGLPFLITFLVLVLSVFMVHFYHATDDLLLRWKFHISIWSFFIVTWVLLECAIVYSGFQIFKELHRIKIGPLNSVHTALGGAIFCIFVGILAAPLMYSLFFTSPENLNGLSRYSVTVENFAAVTEVYENGKYFLLRLAGVIWISVEWVAAIVLFAAYRIFKKVNPPCLD